LEYISLPTKIQLIKKRTSKQAKESMPDKQKTSTKTFRIHYILSLKIYRLDPILVKMK